MEKQKLKLENHCGSIHIHTQGYFKELKKQEGITLISLVVTIVVMLILAGVAISMVVGQNGVGTKAQYAAEDTEVAGVREEISLAWSDCETAYQSDWATNKNADRKDFFTKEMLNKTLKGKVETFEYDEPTNTAKGIYIKDDVLYGFEVGEDGTISIGQEGTAVGEYLIGEAKTAEDPDIEKSKLLKIGDYVSYMPAGEESYTIESIYSGWSSIQKIAKEELNWRVLDVKDGKVRLISSSPTSTRVRLKGYQGYNNVVFILDDLCKTLYSSDIGEAQSLKIEDIESKMNLSVWDYKTCTTPQGKKYGDTFKYQTKKYYPEIFADEKCGSVNGKKGSLGLSEQTELKKQMKEMYTTDLEVESTYWIKNFNETTDEKTKGEYFKNSKYYELYINNGENYPIYWMSSRVVSFNDDSVGYGFRGVYNGEVYAYCYIYNSRGNDYDNYSYLRPVVTLNSNVKIDTTSDSDGTESKPWQIK